MALFALIVIQPKRLPKASSFAEINAARLCMPFSQNGTMIWRDEFCGDYLIAMIRREQVTQLLLQMRCETSGRA
jgi:hypothetical protein